MPHYADGIDAKVGDQVVGKLANSDGVKAGVIVSITPASEACNAMVQFTEVLPMNAVAPKMAVVDRDEDRAIGRTVQGERHGSAGPAFRAWTCADYADTPSLTRVGGAAEKS